MRLNSVRGVLSGDIGIGWHHRYNQQQKPIENEMTPGVSRIPDRALYSIMSVLGIPPPGSSGKCFQIRRPGSKIWRATDQWCTSTASSEFRQGPWPSRGAIQAQASSQTWTCERRPRNGQNGPKTFRFAQQICKIITLTVSESGALHIFPFGKETTHTFCTPSHQLVRFGHVLGSATEYKLLRREKGNTHNVTK